MTRAKENRVVVESAVARFVTHAVNTCGKTQYQIAKESGFGKSNMITMIKQGRTKLPFTKVKSLAISIGVDPKLLLEIAFAEYQPDNWSVIQEIFMHKDISAQRHEHITSRKMVDAILDDNGS